MQGVSDAVWQPSKAIRLQLAHLAQQQCQQAPPAWAGACAGCPPLPAGPLRAQLDVMQDRQNLDGIRLKVWIMSHRKDEQEKSVLHDKAGSPCAGWFLRWLPTAPSCTSALAA